MLNIDVLMIRIFASHGINPNAARRQPGLCWRDHVGDAKFRVSTEN
jgi:hypothetical protein